MARAKNRNARAASAWPHVKRELASAYMSLAAALSPIYKIGSEDRIGPRVRAPLTWAKPDLQSSGCEDAQIPNLKN